MGLRGAILLSLGRSRLCGDRPDARYELAREMRSVVTPEVRADENGRMICESWLENARARVPVQ